MILLCFVTRLYIISFQRAEKMAWCFHKLSGHHAKFDPCMPFLMLPDNISTLGVFLCF